MLLEVSFIHITTKVLYDGEMEKNIRGTATNSMAFAHLLIAFSLVASLMVNGRCFSFGLTRRDISQQFLSDVEPVLLSHITLITRVWEFTGVHN